MRIPALTLFDRAVRSDVRAVSMMLARTALMAIVLLSLSSVQVTTRFSLFGAPGLHFFSTIIYIDFFFIVLAGLSYFASAITEEKEELTLGLLQMAGLSPMSILLGKSTSRLCGAALLLLAQFPFTLLAVTLGGVTVVQVVAAYCTLLAFCFLMCNVALLWSVVFRSTVLAAVFTAVCLFVIIVGPRILLEICQGLANSYTIELNQGWGLCLHTISRWGTAASPITRIEEILRTGFNGFPSGFQVLANVVTGVVFFVLARLAFDRFTRNEIEESPARVVFVRRGSAGSRVPSSVTGAAAITWKDYRFMIGGTSTVVVKFFLLAALVAGLTALVSRTDEHQVKTEYLGVAAMMVAMIGFAVDAAFNTSRIFRHELRWKTISTLMLLPYSTSEIASRKVTACLKSLTPYIVLFVVGMIVFPKPVNDFFAELGRSSTFAFGMLFAAVQFVFFLHLVAYLSLVIKRGALPLAIAIQYVGGICLAMPIAFLSGGMRGSGETIMVLLTFASIALTILLRARIGSRLIRAAAED